MFVGRLLISAGLRRGSSNCRILTNRRWKSASNHEITDAEQKEGNDKAKEATDESGLPPEPTFCCMSGCANCVWIKYAQDIAQLFDNGDEIAKRKISEKVHDPKLKAYLFKQLGLEYDEQKK